MKPVLIVAINGYVRTSKSLHTIFNLQLGKLTQESMLFHIRPELSSKVVLMGCHDQTEDNEVLNDEIVKPCLPSTVHQHT